MPYDFSKFKPGFYKALRKNELSQMLSIVSSDYVSLEKLTAQQKKFLSTQDLLPSHLQARTYYAKVGIEAVDISASFLDGFYSLSKMVDLTCSCTLALTTSLATLGLSILAAVVFFYRSHNKRQEQSQNTQENLSSLFLKRTIIRRLEFELISYLRQFPEQSEYADYLLKNCGNDNLKSVPNQPPIYRSVFQGAVLGSVLGAAVLYSIPTLAKTLGFVLFASALSGPVGLGIAFGVIAIISAYIGYQHYQFKKSKYATQHFIQSLDSEVNRSTHRMNLLLRRATDLSTTIPAQSKLVKAKSKCDLSLSRCSFWSKPKAYRSFNQDDFGLKSRTFVRG